MNGFGIHGQRYRLRFKEPSYTNFVRIEIQVKKFGFLWVTFKKYDFLVTKDSDRNLLKLRRKAMKIIEDLQSNI
jgi:hypothetical protein